MKKIQTVLFILLIIIICSPAALFSAFQDINIGVRPAGMGGAFVALADDINALYSNVAGLALIDDRTEINTMYGQPYVGLSNDILVSQSFGCASNFIFGTLGLSLTNLKSNLYQECSVGIACAIPLGLFSDFSLGATVKGIGKKYTENEYTLLDPVFVNLNPLYGFTADVGFLYHVEEGIGFGISAENISQPDIHLQEPDIVPLKAKIGIAYRAEEKGTGAIDISYTNNARKEIRARIGAETWIADRNCGLRAGFGIGNYNFANATCGFSFCLGPQDGFSVQIDYALEYSLSGSMVGTSGTHLLATTIRWGL